MANVRTRKRKQIETVEELTASIESGRTQVDLNGHCPMEPRWLAESFSISLFARKFGRLAKDIGEMVKKKVEIPEHASMAYCECYYCGKTYHLNLSDDDRKISVVSKDAGPGQPCEYPNALTDDWSIELDCPSGEFIIFNDLRYDMKGKPLFCEPRCSINSLGGKRQYSEEFAREGLGLIFVGNSSPTVRQESLFRLSVGSFSRSSKKDLGSICTDLWWFSIVDLSVFESKFNMTPDEFEEEYHRTGRWPDLIRAKVKRGRYKISSRYHLVDESAPIKIYSEIKKIP